MKFNPPAVILPKTILSVNEPHINKKFALNNAMQFVLFYFYPCVFSLSFDNSF